MKQRSNQWILIIILVISVVLRMFNFSEIPFTHDEFSALDRLDFDSFSALINEGVKIDGHPAGVQVFLFYWSKIFGLSEQAIKFPFIVFGVLAVYFTYLIGKRWFNETVGLLTAAVVSSLQYTVMFSQIARPYISGLLFSLMLVYYLTKLIQKPEKNFLLNGILFVISGALCAYNHHFSLLFAAIVGLSGAFFIKKQFLFKYFLLGIGIFVLYIPHLNIFFYQLSLGGVEQWLGKPKPDFLIHFISFIFNYSWILISTVLGISLGFFFIKRSVKINWKVYLLFASWFTLPFLIGYFYSVYFSAVLHNSVLIFSFTFILFLFFGHLPNCKPKTNLLLVSIVMLAGIYSLIFERQYYTYFYQSCYVKVLEDYEEVKESEENVLSIIQSVEHINNYYIKELEIDFNYTWYNDFESMSELKLFIAKNVKNYDKLYLGSLHNIDPRAIPIILDYYPNIEMENNYFGGATYLFSKKNADSNSKKSNKISLISMLDFEDESTEYWNYDAQFITDLKSVSGSNSYLINSEIEYGPSYTIQLEKISQNKSDFIDFSLKAKENTSFNDAVLVVTLESNGESVFWTGYPLEEAINSDSLSSEWSTTHVSLNLSSIYLNYDHIQLKSLIWNRGKGEFLIDDFKVNLREGNPVVYGTMEGF
ncbi:glycosyltransferase family 39 protein [Brumimicrobium mesophilum]|uniref:glycosyltransferase family 39 protein n=1 Tax=Brumimicrobium mesophilum TaxID=392717 RepID=UPI000D13FE1F|nr:glycosyltransferase family 39 protein [Brumimicrobium mesophilum]